MDAGTSSALPWHCVCVHFNHHHHDKQCSFKWKNQCHRWFGRVMQPFNQIQIFLVKRNRQTLRVPRLFKHIWMSCWGLSLESNRTLLPFIFTDNYIYNPQCFSSFSGQGSKNREPCLLLLLFFIIIKVKYHTFFLTVKQWIQIFSIKFRFPSSFQGFASVLEVGEAIKS